MEIADTEGFGEETAIPRKACLVKLTVTASIRELGGVEHHINWPAAQLVPTWFILRSLKKRWQDIFENQIRLRYFITRNPRFCVLNPKCISNLEEFAALGTGQRTRPKQKRVSRTFVQALSMDRKPGSTKTRLSLSGAKRASFCKRAHLSWSQINEFANIILKSAVYQGGI